MAATAALTQSVNVDELFNGFAYVCVLHVICVVHEVNAVVEFSTSHHWVITHIRSESNAVLFMCPVGTI